MTVAVTNSAGEPIADLQEKDFGVLDNGSVQPIRSFKLIDLASSGNANWRSSGSPRFLYALMIDRAKATGQRVFHRLDVRVDRPDVNVQTMKGYYTEPDKN